MLPAAFLVGLLLNTGASAVDQKTEPGWHLLDIRQQPQGLPQNSVYAILQTSDGYLWVGTKGGLARFDGARFATFSALNPNQLRASEVQALVEGDDSSLWIATYGGGVSRLKDGQFTTYTSKDGLVNDYPMALCKDAEGGIWIGSESGVSRFKSGLFTNYTVKEGLADNNTLALQCDSDGSVWMGAQNGELREFRDGKILAPVTETPKLGSAIRVLHRDRQQALWIGTNDGLFRFQEGKLTHYTTKDGLSSNLVRRLYEDPQGNLWIGTHDGLNRYKDGKISSSHLPPVVSQTNLTAIAGDREGNLWVGSHYQGLFRLHQGQFVSYTKEDGLTNDDIQTFVEDDTGTLWIGTDRGLNAFRNGKFTAYSAKNGLPAKRADPHAEDRGGHLWIDIEDSGLYRSRSPIGCNRQPCNLESLTFQSVIPKLRTRAVLQDRAGAVWIGTDENGVLRFKDENATSYTTYTVGDGLPSNRIKDLAEGPMGDLWIGTTAGLALYRNGNFRVYTEKDGLGGNFVEQLYIDTEGILWIASSRGISRFRDERFTNYTVNDGLPCETISHMIEDDRRNLWMSCNRGIFRVSKQQLDDFTAGKIHSISPVVYGLEHGLSATVPAAGFNPAAYKSRDGRVWFAMIRGLCVADPEKLALNPLPPPVHLEEVNIDQRPFASRQAVEAPPGKGDLEFHYTGLSFLAPEKVRFKYRLEGYDHDWIDARDRRVAYYGNIPPGRYTFRVIAANNDGVWNEAGASLALYLQPHFYQTYWFLGTWVLGAVLSGAGAYRLRIHRLRARERELEEQVRQRTKELQDARDKLEDRVRQRTAELQDDITERKRVEAELRRSEDKFSRVFHSSPAALSISSLETGSIIDVNDNFISLFGYRYEEVIQNTAAELQLWENPEEREKILNAVREKNPVRNQRVSFRTKASKIFNSLLSVEIVSFSGKNCLLSVNLDVSEQLRLEEQLRQSQKMEAIGTLSGGVAHDFNNLLTVIRGYSQILLGVLEESSALRTPMKQIDEAAEKAALLTRQLLAFSRRQVLQPRVVNLNTLMANLEQMLRRVIGEDIDLMFVPAPALGFVEADPHQLEHVVMNLVVNARDAMPIGGKLTLETANVVLGEDYAREHVVVKPGAFVMLSVSDTGIGMDAETQSHIFEPFFTTKELGKGTGLGLSMVYGIVKQSGGYIWVYSEPGKGTAFKVYLPRVQASAESKVKEQHSQSVRGTETILLVEDDAGVRNFAKLVLAEAGYSVLAVENVTQVGPLCESYSGPIHLLLTDVVMPGIGGREVAKQVASRKPQVKVLYMSGYTVNAIVHHGSLDGDASFLPKPFTPDSLLSKVREVLDKDKS